MLEGFFRKFLLVQGLVFFNSVCGCSHVMPAQATHVGVSRPAGEASGESSDSKTAIGIAPSIEGAKKYTTRCEKPKSKKSVLGELPKGLCWDARLDRVAKENVRVATVSPEVHMEVGALLWHFGVPEHSVLSQTMKVGDLDRVGMMAASFLQESVNRGFSRIGVASSVSGQQNLVVIVLGRCLASMEELSKRQVLGRTVRLKGRLEQGYSNSKIIATDPGGMCVRLERGLDQRGFLLLSQWTCRGFGKWKL